MYHESFCLLFESDADAFCRKLMVNPSDDFLKAMKEEVGIEVGLV